MPSRQVQIEETIASLRWKRYVKPCPITGTIEQVQITWRDGCKDLVDVAVGMGDRWLVPSESRTYIARNGTTLTFPCKEAVGKGETLWAEMNNGDESNDHFISVVLSVIG